MKSKNRFSRKIDKIFWFIVALLPIIIYFVTAYRNPSAPDFFTFCISWRFDYVSRIFESVFATSFGGAEIGILMYLSYVVCVEIAHCMFDILVFIPRLAHKFISKAVQDD